MTVPTYGEHAEAAARALNRLLQLDSIPAEPDAVEPLLHFREAIVDALRQRLYGVGLKAMTRGGDLPSPAQGLNLEGIDNKLGTLLSNIAFSAPSLPVAERLSLLEVRSDQSTDAITQPWREAAVQLLAGTHALDAASDKPWLHDRGGGWYVLRDIAVAMEAVLVLDARLAEVGLLQGHDHPRDELGLEAKRLVVSQAARVATWYATSDAADQATPRAPVSAHDVLHPIALVSIPEDLAAAQERLAAFLRPTRASDGAYSGEPEISADSARQLTASQLLLSQVFAGVTARNHRTRTLVPFFNERAEVLTSLQPQLRYLVDARVLPSNRRRFWQQSEITTAIARMRDRHTDLRLQPAQMLALANATHEATHNLGACLRRELLRSNSNLRDANPRLEDGPIPISRRSRLGTTVTDLINLPAPAAAVAQFTTPLQRAALRQTLDLTPTHRRPPSPHPGARMIDVRRGPGR